MASSDILHTSKIFRMKVKFLKDHGGNKKDDVVEVPDAQANYFIRTSVATEYIEPDIEEPAEVDIEDTGNESEGNDEETETEEMNNGSEATEEIENPEDAAGSGRHESEKVKKSDSKKEKAEPKHTPKKKTDGIPK